MTEQSPVSLKWRARDRTADQPLWTTASQARGARQFVEFETAKVTAGDVQVILEQLRSYGQQWLDTYPEADAAMTEAYVTVDVVRGGEEVRLRLAYFAQRRTNGAAL